MITTASFWKGAAERALKTFFQTFVAVLVAGVGADAIGLTAGLGSVDWLTAASVSALAAILSIATSLGNSDFTAGVPTGLPPEEEPIDELDYDDADLNVASPDATAPRDGI